MVIKGGPPALKSVEVALNAVDASPTRADVAPNAIDASPTRAFGVPIAVLAFLALLLGVENMFLNRATIISMT
jgi:hypothetical protein